MYYSAIKYNDIANGPGIRVSLFVSGCTNRCPGCFNKNTWAFDNGFVFTEETENEIIENLSKARYKGITILGGEPFELQNQPSVLHLIQKIRNDLPEKDIWLYTGFTYEKDLAPGGKRYIPDVTNKILELSDVLVDGRFILEQKDISLTFRGSANQRILDLHASTCDNIVMRDDIM